jgi:hypothetical protein
MRLMNALNSRIGRIAQVIVAVWLFFEGTALGTLGGLLMMMVGVVLAVTGLAGDSFAREVLVGRHTRHGGPRHAHEHRA